MIGRRSLLLAGAAFPVRLARGRSASPIRRLWMRAAAGCGLLVAAWRDARPDLGFLGPTLDPRITFTRAEHRHVFRCTGTMQTAASNAPRFDYDPVTHALRGLLIEEQRTNHQLSASGPTIAGL